MPAPGSAAREKSDDGAGARRPPALGMPPARRHSPGFVILSAVLLWVVIWHRVFPSVGLRRDEQTLPVDAELPTFFEWSQIEPSERLVWHPCSASSLSRLQCARLTVPMDYHRPLHESPQNPKVHLALLMVPGVNRTDSPLSYGVSPLLLNPGGPGGSGSVFASTAGPSMQRAVGSDWDLIGFDPRGVGWTTPKADCFAADDSFGVAGRNVALANRMAWVYSGHDVGLVNSSNVALAKVDVRSRAVARLCKQGADRAGNDSIFHYSNTPNVARDLLSIVRAWDEWRAEAAVTAKPGSHAEVTEPAHGDGTNADSNLKPKSTKGKLVYIGYSYGTLLGATFAAMFPDKVGRVVLDGVVDADHYVDPVWQDSLIDADAIWAKFFDYCVDAGALCSYYQAGDSPEDQEERFNELMTSLQEEARIVVVPGKNTPVVVTASDIKGIIFKSLYSPNVVFPIVADVITALATNHGLEQFVFPPSLPALCQNVSLPVWPDDAQKAVMCSDKRYRLNDTVPALQKRFEDMASYSSFADVWMTLMMGCNGWDIEARDPPMRWDDHPAHKPAPIRTDFPVLFMSNHFDPVTPLNAALKMVRKFANASIVEQRAEGHCALSCVSLCTYGHLRAYLDEGKLPPAPEFDGPSSGKWTQCECLEKPWKSLPLHGGEADTGDDADEDVLEGFSAEDAETLRNLGDLRDEFVKHTVQTQFGSHHASANAISRFTEAMLAPQRCKAA